MSIQLIFSNVQWVETQKTKLLVTLDSVGWYVYRLSMCQDFNMDALRASVCMVAMRFWASWRKKTGLELTGHVWAMRGLLEDIILHAAQKPWSVCESKLAE